MAFVQLEYTFGEQDGRSSVEIRKTLEGYALYPSHSFDRVRDRLFRLTVASAMFVLGSSLLLSPDVLITSDGLVAAVIRAIGLYIAASGLFWCVQALRRAPELAVDLRNRALHLVRLNWRGIEVSRKSIRFEEISDIRLIERLPALDMRSDAMGWSMGRLEVVWRKDNVAQVITGDISELELIAARLRREVGHY